MTKREVATLFGTSLDNDDYDITRTVLAEACEYKIGLKTIIGPEAISKSYEDNMIEGKRKLDKLEWGKSVIEDLSEDEFLVHFTDYLTHAGQEYIHRCQQKLTVDSDNKIIQIEHIENSKEQEKLAAFYKSVGIG